MARGNPFLPHVINKYHIAFLDAEHAKRYDTIVSRKICAPSYLDVDMLRTLHLYDDLVILLGNLGWTDFVRLQELVYERLIWEFMSSLVVDFTRKFDEVRGYICFRLLTILMKCTLLGLTRCCVYPLRVPPPTLIPPTTPKSCGPLSLVLGVRTKLGLPRSPGFVIRCFVTSNA